MPPDFYEFYNLGLGDPIAVSAVHGHGTGDLLDECMKYFPPEEEDEEEDDRIKVAVGSMPPVSTILNFLPSHSHSAYSLSRVTPGVSSTMDSLRPQSLLKSMLFPTLGLPTMAMRGFDMF